MSAFVCPFCQITLDAPVCPHCKASAIVVPEQVSRLVECQARKDDDEDAPKQLPKTSGANVAAAGAGAAAGVGIGMIVVVVFGILGCCVCLPGALVGVGYYFVQKLVGTATDIAITNNVREIAMACHTYHGSKGALPSPRMQPQPPENISPELSWRVSILPQLRQQSLYNDFDKNQAWNGPKNQPLVARIPIIYTHPAGGKPDRTHTRYQYFTGPNTLFPDPLTRVKLTDITDGQGNTFLVAEAATEQPWSKPADMAVGGGALPLPEGRFIAAFCDGSARVINRSSAKDDILRQAIDPKDGKQMPAGWGD
ncbi:MAG: DUF1559 domain-containing protein [Planctomycetes bacterium]|nr:DUF1559 domain-containing protein [Planctomycetota bacterium]